MEPPPSTCTLKRLRCPCSQEEDCTLKQVTLRTLWDMIPCLKIVPFPQEILLTFLAHDNCNTRVSSFLHQTIFRDEKDNELPHYAVNKNI
jgi:hypothetical protein